MFRKTAFLGLFVFVILCIGCYALFLRMRPSDLATYRADQARRQQITTSQSKPFSSTTQNRLGVRKEIWFTQEDHTRLTYRIESRSSLLTLLPNQDKIDVIENLEDLKCWMQERLLYNTTDGKQQQVRLIEAAKGSYRYTSQQFIANSVTLSLFRLPGHELQLSLNPANAFLKGIAKDVFFSISGKTPQFHAQHFQASLTPSGG